MSPPDPFVQDPAELEPEPMPDFEPEPVCDDCWARETECRCEPLTAADETNQLVQEFF